MCENSGLGAFHYSDEILQVCNMFVTIISLHCCCIYVAICINASLS